MSICLLNHVYNITPFGRGSTHLINSVQLLKQLPQVQPYHAQYQDDENELSFKAFLSIPTH